MQPQTGGWVEGLANLSSGSILLGLLVLTAVRLAFMSQRAAVARILTEFAESILPVAAFYFLVIRPFLFQSFYIPTPSMEPTLLGHVDGTDPKTGITYTDTARDRIFANRLAYRVGDPQRGDIAVFRSPKRANPNEDILIKRVMGIPGDTIEVKRDPQGVMRVWRNGEPLVEPVCGKDKPSRGPCINEPMVDPQPMDAHFATEGPLKLGPGEYFMMGDNRNLSYDSRYWGTVTRDRFIGRAAFLWWPLNRIGFIR